MSNMLIGIEGISRKIKKMYVGVDGIARKVKKGYVGIDGIAHVFFSGASLPPGTIFDFDYTGQVQEVTLPEGRYKLQCWGAQGGKSYSYSGAGSNGGYSEGIITLTETTTLYVFVGGRGGNGSSGMLANGGWNGGGGSVGQSSYSDGDEYGISYPACGGGGTDIASVSSEMAYVSGRTNRSAASLLSRCIVAGGGAGGSARYTEITNTYNDWVFKSDKSSSTEKTWTNSSGGVIKYKMCVFDVHYYIGKNVKCSISALGAQVVQAILYNQSNAEIARYNAQAASADITFTLPAGVSTVECQALGSVDGLAPGTNISKFYVYEPTSSTSTGSGNSNTGSQGGGTSGCGSYPGSQTAAGRGGSFGSGANQAITNYRYASGAGGGGWYGGGSDYSDSSTSYISRSGGGSGFVNTFGATRPSGYTGLQLDSGVTIDGAASFPAPASIINEIGHPGNGYARIIAVDEDGNYPVVKPDISIAWSVRSGTWNSVVNGNAKDGKQYTCTSPGTSGSTVLRCTFSGISQISFRCRYQGENNYDYLTVGNLDVACTRSSYNTTLKGTTGTWKSITFTPSTNEHYIEFCYSKDGSGDISPDNADVYIESYL